VRLRKDGRRNHVALTISAIRDGHDRIVGASAIPRYITERKRAEERRQRFARRNIAGRGHRGLQRRQGTLRSVYKFALRPWYATLLRRLHVFGRSAMTRTILSFRLARGSTLTLAASTREFLSEVESMIALPRSFFVQPFGKSLSARRLHCQNSAREWLSWWRVRGCLDDTVPQGAFGRRDDFELLHINGENCFVFPAMLPEVISSSIRITNTVSRFASCSLEQRPRAAMSSRVRNQD